MRCGAGPQPRDQGSATVNHLTEEQLVLYHYGDAAESAGTASIEEHLHACAACEADLVDLGRTLNAVDALPVPDRGDGYGSEVLSLIHISEPTRLGMISYAVFCLKKK